MAFTITRKFVIPFTSFKVFTTRKDLMPLIIFIDFTSLVKRKIEKNGKDPTVDKIMINKSKIFHLLIWKNLSFCSSNLNSPKNSLL